MADISETIRKILTTHLKEFKVKKPTIDTIVDEIMSAANAPEKSKYGAVVMTHEASKAADDLKKNEGHASAARPKVV